jgi:pyruvyltransferase
MPVYLKQFTKYPNAGDVASSYIVSRLLQEKIVVTGQADLGHPNLVAIGSILHWADTRSVVWGSGLVSAEIRLRRRPAKLLAVRGHLTHERLAHMGVDGPGLVGDPGILISGFYTPMKRTPNGVGIIPHYADAEHPYVMQALQNGAVLIDPLSPLESYLSAIASCDVVISSSLHGIVFAHSYGVPASWVSLSDRVLGEGFKFRDYYSSIGFGAGEAPELTGSDPFWRAVDHASLPKTEIDRNALREALLGEAAKLAEQA